jgi:hypothetical protein
MKGSLKAANHEIVMVLGGIVLIALMVSVATHRMPASHLLEGFSNPGLGKYASDTDSPATWFSSLAHNPAGSRTPAETVESGQMAFFADTLQSPECCPSTYSGSMGCVCPSVAQMKYLNERGGNRTLDSEY